jgi:hypothetical protein
MDSRIELVLEMTQGSHGALLLRRDAASKFFGISNAQLTSAFQT